MNDLGEECGIVVVHHCCSSYIYDDEKLVHLIIPAHTDLRLDLKE
jgi:hypothetical protein